MKTCGRAAISRQKLLRAADAPKYHQALLIPQEARLITRRNQLYTHFRRWQRGMPGSERAAESWTESRAAASQSLVTKDANSGGKACMIARINHGFGSGRLSPFVSIVRVVVVVSVLGVVSILFSTVVVV